MKIEKIILQHKDGSLHYVDGLEDIIAILKAMPTKLKWKHTASIETMHNKYFALLDELAKSGQTGYSKSELHEALKPLIFGKFTDFTHLFKDGVNTGSTKDLTHAGWVAVIEQLKIVANDICGYVFK